jgi:PAS domain S-box-containing protein
MSSVERELEVEGRVRIGARTGDQVLLERERADLVPHGEEQFRAVADSVADGIASLDADGHVTYFNPAAQLTYGYRPAEVLGEHFTLLLADAWRSEYERAIRRFRSTGRSELVGTTGEVEGVRRNGEIFPAEIVLSPWTADGETHFMAILRDITERKTLARLEESNCDLERFAYVASHDLSEPLRTVSSYVQLIDSRYGSCLGRDGEDFIEFALEGAQRMQALIDGLLDYSRASSATYEIRQVDCNEVAGSVLALLRAKVEESRATVQRGELPTVWGDARQISQVFQNLISNALTYRSEKPRIELGAERIVGGWCLSVSDNGIGIPRAGAERIFEMLERLHTQQQYAGSGMGLAICKRIVERHGGRIWAESIPGSGTRFRFTIPDCDRASS